MHLLLTLRDTYSVVKTVSCTEVVKMNTAARRNSSQRNVDRSSWTLTRAPEWEVGRGRQDVFAIVISHVWRMTRLSGLYVLLQNAILIPLLVPSAPSQF